MHSIRFTASALPIATRTRLTALLTPQNYKNYSSSPNKTRFSAFKITLSSP